MSSNEAQEQGQTSMWSLKIAHPPGVESRKVHISNSTQGVGDLEGKVDGEIEGSIEGLREGSDNVGNVDGGCEGAEVKG